MKKILYFILGMLLFSCTADDLDRSAINKKIISNGDDTLNLTIKVDTLPYNSNFISIYADSFDIKDSVIIYNNSNFYINSYDYSIKDIKFDNSYKTIQLIRTSNKIEYWCSDNVKLKLINFILVKKI